MANGAFEWIEIPAPNFAASTEFYREIFGWKVQTPEEGKDYPMFEVPAGSMGGGFTRSSQPGAGAGPVIYVTVDSIDKVLPAIERRGGQTVKPKTLISAEYGWWALFRDPGGNVLGLFEKTRK